MSNILCQAGKGDEHRGLNPAKYYDESNWTWQTPAVKAVSSKYRYFTVPKWLEVWRWNEDEQSMEVREPGRFFPSCLAHFEDIRNRREITADEAERICREIDRRGTH